MPKVESTKKYLLVKRAELMEQCKREGFNGADIGIIFNIDRSNVARVLQAHKNSKNYKITK